MKQYIANVCFKNCDVNKYEYTHIHNTHMWTCSICSVNTNTKRYYAIVKEYIISIQLHTYMNIHTDKYIEYTYITVNM